MPVASGSGWVTKKNRQDIIWERNGCGENSLFFPTTKVDGEREKYYINVYVPMLLLTQVRN